jgi:integrase
MQQGRIHTMDLVPVQTDYISVGQLANEYAANSVFNDYHERLSANTLKRQRRDIKLFTDFLAMVGMIKDNLMYDTTQWTDVTFGLVEAFRKQQLLEGYSIASVNAHLITVKLYAKLAKNAGKLCEVEYSRIRDIKTYSHKDGRNVDAKREQTRRPDAKKANPVSLSTVQVALLKDQPNTPQGRRDALLMCLLLDHGLRCGEVAALSPESINLSNGTLTFYRQKVDKTQNHILTRDTLLAAMRYLEVAKPVGKLLMGSRKGGKLEGVMSERAITDRVRVLAEKVGVNGLSAHDCRHDWATDAIRNGTDIKSLQDAGGWSSPAMPLRYAESTSIANSGVKLSSKRSERGKPTTRGNTDGSSWQQALQN